MKSRFKTAISSMKDTIAKQPELRCWKYLIQHKKHQCPICCSENPSGTLLCCSQKHSGAHWLLSILLFLKANITRSLKISKNAIANDNSLKRHQTHLHKAPETTEVIVRTFTLYSTGKFFRINFRDLKPWEGKKPRELRQNVTELKNIINSKVQILLSNNLASKP